MFATFLLYGQWEKYRIYLFRTISMDLCVITKLKLRIIRFGFLSILELTAIVITYYGTKTKIMYYRISTSFIRIFKFQ